MHFNFNSDQNFLKRLDFVVLEREKKYTHTYKERERRVNYIALSPIFRLGMTSAAPAFLTFGRNQSAAYKFSDAGYDVWIANARGNTYSKRHMTLSPADPRFWEFS